MVFTKCDLILHKYYITGGTKVRVKVVKKTKEAHELAKGGPANWTKGDLVRTWSFATPLAPQRM